MAAHSGSLAAAAQARTAMAAAQHRLVANAPAPTAGAVAVPSMRSWATEHDIGFDGYRLPAWPCGRGGSSAPASSAMEPLVVTGRSGSGKSTLLRALASSLRQSLDAHDNRPAVTAIAADDYLFTGTLGSNWRLADPAMTDEDVDERLVELRLDHSGLTARTPVGPGGSELSGGELRRVYLGRALATRPHVLIVDEPTTGVDEQTAQHVLGILIGLSDTTVVIATHEVPASLRSLGHVSTLPLD